MDLKGAQDKHGRQEIGRKISTQSSRNAKVSCHCAAAHASEGLSLPKMMQDIHGIYKVYRRYVFACES